MSIRCYLLAYLPAFAFVVAAADARVSASEPDLRMSGSPAANADEGPRLIRNVDAELRVLAGKIRAEVESSLQEAHRLTGSNPGLAEQNLKLLLERLEAIPELEPESLLQLRQQVRASIRDARQSKVAADQAAAAAQARNAAAQELERLQDRLTLDQQRLKQIVDRFDALMSEQRFEVATDHVIPEIERLAAGSSLQSSLTHDGGLVRSVNEGEVVVRRRNNQFVRTMDLVEQAFTPFPDEPPIVYLPADKWQEITLRREKYKAVDLAKAGSAEQRIFAELNRTTNLNVVEMPLKDVVDYLAGLHRIPIVLSRKKLEEGGVNADTPVTKSLRDITLRSALRLLLRDLELTYVVRDEVLQITTPEDAESQLTTKVYPVGDLVIPIAAGGGLFGLGGGGINGALNGGGLGGGGYGGGFGGGGFGGGGFGGGGFGGGGGAGGGIF